MTQILRINKESINYIHNIQYLSSLEFVTEAIYFMYLVSSLTRNQTTPPILPGRSQRNQLWLPQGSQHWSLTPDHWKPTLVSSSCCWYQKIGLVYAMKIGRMAEGLERTDSIFGLRARSHPVKPVTLMCSHCLKNERKVVKS